MSHGSFFSLWVNKIEVDIQDAVKLAFMSWVLVIQHPEHLLSGQPFLLRSYHPPLSDKLNTKERPLFFAIVGYSSMTNLFYQP